MPSPLCALPDDILVDWMLFLAVADIMALRQVNTPIYYCYLTIFLTFTQTCKSLSRRTRIKDLWIHLLRRDVPAGDRALPAYYRSYESLTDFETEALTTNAMKIYRTISHGLKPATAIPLHQPRSVTWVRLVQGQWLLAASSDASTSVICLWSLRSVLSKGASTAPQAQAFLEGPVASGDVEVQDGRVVVALDIRSP